MDDLRFFKQRLEFSKARFEAIAQTATDSIVIAAENSSILFANKKTYEIFGYQESELIALSLEVLMPEKYRKAHRAGLERFINSGIPKLIGHTIEIEGVRKDGGVFPVELSLSCWQEEKNYFFSGIIRDITKRKEQEKALQHTNQELAAALEELQSAEEHLRELNNELEQRVVERTQELAASEEQLRMITDALPVLISYVNSEQEFVFVNQGYTTWFGKPKEEVLGKQVSEILGETAYANVKEKVKKVLLGEEVRFEEPMAYRFRGTRDTIIHLIPHKVGDKIVGFFALVSDISSLRKVQAELSKKNSELIRINTDLDNFIYTASHDLKSPIANMEGLSKMMEQSLKGKLNEKEQKSLAMMDASIVKLKNTINHLSDVTKIAKNLDQPSEIISIAAIVKDVKSDVNHLIQEATPTFIEEYEVEQMEIAKAKFGSIAYNLISNAIKYRSPDRPLVISIKSYGQKDYIVFSVQDNGLGLLPNQQDKLFTMFRRLHTHVEGTGVGLYIVKRTIENIGGKITVESKVEKGSTFSVYFPKEDNLK